MLSNLKKGFLPFLIGFSALSVSASAAFYSVFGLSKLFAGASTEVIIMAGSLEVAKLVIASLLYQYRKTIPRLLKIYLTSAAVVLVLFPSHDHKSNLRVNISCFVCCLLVSSR